MEVQLHTDMAAIDSNSWRSGGGELLCSICGSSFVEERDQAGLEDFSLSICFPPASSSSSSSSSSLGPGQGGREQLREIMSRVVGLRSQGRTALALPVGGGGGGGGGGGPIGILIRQSTSAAASAMPPAELFRVPAGTAMLLGPPSGLIDGSAAGGSDRDEPSAAGTGGGGGILGLLNSLGMFRQGQGRVTQILAGSSS
eukprot:gene35401-45867_t